VSSGVLPTLHRCSTYLVDTCEAYFVCSLSWCAIYAHEIVGQVRHTMSCVWFSGLNVDLPSFQLFLAGTEEKGLLCPKADNIRTGASELWSTFEHRNDNCSGQIQHKDEQRKWQNLLYPLNRQNPTTQDNYKPMIYSSSASPPPPPLAIIFLFTRPGRPPPWGEVRANSMCFSCSTRTRNEGMLTIWLFTLHHPTYFSSQKGPEL